MQGVLPLKPLSNQKSSQTVVNMFTGSHPYKSNFVHPSHSLDYCSVDQLFPPLDDGLLVDQVAKKGSTRRQVWISAPGWKPGTYCIQIAFRLRPKLLLSLCSTNASSASISQPTRWPPALRYVSSFGRPQLWKSCLRWDALKVDVLVWCVTHQPFHASDIRFDVKRNLQIIINNN